MRADSNTIVRLYARGRGNIIGNNRIATTGGSTVDSMICGIRADGLGTVS
jgi:hypothetical protein